MELGGCLLIIATRTWPSTVFAVSFLCRKKSHPSPNHRMAFKRLLRYLRVTTDLALRIDGNEEKFILGSSDTDLTGDRNEQKRTTRGLTLLCGASLLGKIKKAL